MSEFTEELQHWHFGPPLVPDEEKVARAVAEHLAPILELASSLFDLSTNLFDEGPEIPRALLPDTVQLGAGMYSQILKCYRSVIANAQLGLAEQASAACRILFENSAALSFIFRHSIVLRQFEKGVLVNVDTGDQALSVDFRAQLYELHERYENRRWVEDVDRLGANEDLISDLRSEVEAAAFTEELELRVGAAWSKRVKNQRHYSGLNLKSVAITLGHAYWAYYLLRYRPLSWNVHAGNASSSVRTSVDNDDNTVISIHWSSPPDELRLPVLDATALTFLAIKVFIRRFANSHRNNRDLHALYAEFAALDRPRASDRF